MQARHGFFFYPQHCTRQFASVADRQLAELHDWVFTWTCCIHSCSGGLKWGLKSPVPQDEMLEGVHVTISSLSKASAGLLMSVRELIVGYVEFDRPAPTSVVDVELMWAFLDVEPAHPEGARGQGRRPSIPIGVRVLHAIVGHGNLFRYPQRVRSRPPRG